MLVVVLMSIFRASPPSPAPAPSRWWSGWTRSSWRPARSGPLRPCAAPRTVGHWAIREPQPLVVFAVRRSYGRPLTPLPARVAAAAAAAARNRNRSPSPSRSRSWSCRWGGSKSKGLEVEDVPHVARVAVPVAVAAGVAVGVARSRRDSKSKTSITLPATERSAPSASDW